MIIRGRRSPKICLAVDGVILSELDRMIEKFHKVLC